MVRVSGIQMLFEAWLLTANYRLPENSLGNEDSEAGYCTLIIIPIKAMFTLIISLFRSLLWTTNVIGTPIYYSPPKDLASLHPNDMAIFRNDNCCPMQLLSSAQLRVSLHYFQARS